VRRALKILSEREVSPQIGLIKSTLLQLDSTFSERTYGASSFLDFVEKLAQSGLVQLKQTGRSVMVELNEKFDESESSTAATVAGSPPVALAQPPAAIAEAVQTAQLAPTEAPVVPKGDQAGGVQLVREILTAATAARWPMYLRNVKQLLRATEGGFDERRYGFTGLIDLLRACQRDGLVRLERDRRGGLRVLRGPALQQTGPSPVMASTQEVAEAEPEVESLDMRDTQPVEAVDRFEQEEQVEEDRFNVAPMPTDTTAKPRRSRVPRKANPKKTSARASTRSRKPTGSETPGKNKT